MRKFVLLALLAGAAFFVQQRNTHSPAGETKAAVAATPVPSITPRPASEHDWAKRSIDRAHEVVEQVQQSRGGTEQP